MKIAANDLLAILRRFNIAREDDLPRRIDQIKNSNPSPINQLVRFRFNRQHYFVLIDDTAEDRENYIMEQIFTAKSDARGVIFENPTSELTTYGLPFKGKDIYLFQQVSDSQRLDSLLAKRYPETSRSTWQKYIKSGNISVNGTPAKSTSQLVTEADEIAVNLPEAVDYSSEELPIIYLDDSVIVVNKPAGVLTHSKGALNDEFTVADFFRRYTTVGLETNRPGIVHRLDRDTSGIIIGARTPEAFDLLKKQFSQHLAKKTYLAIVDGTPQPLTAKIDIPIGRNPSAPSTFRPDPNGKPAQTIYQTLAARDNLSAIKLCPQTGRTHQLRVHLRHLRTPIHGDRVYGKPADRLYLHAYKLEITTQPSKRQTFVAPLPSEFIKLFPELGDESNL